MGLQRHQAFSCSTWTYLGRLFTCSLTHFPSYLLARSLSLSPLKNQSGSNHYAHISTTMSHTQMAPDFAKSQAWRSNLMISWLPVV